NSSGFTVSTIDRLRGPRSARHTWLFRDANMAVRGVLRLRKGWCAKSRQDVNSAKLGFEMKAKIDPARLIRAMEYTGLAEANGFPPVHAWERAQPICFDSDWQGKNNDPSRATQVRVLWTSETLYLEFRCRY